MGVFQDFSGEKYETYIITFRTRHRGVNDLYKYHTTYKPEYYGAVEKYL